MQSWLVCVDAVVSACFANSLNCTMASGSDHSTFNKVFVYGTLKRGQPNHYIMTEDPEKNGIAKFYANGLTVDKYPLVIASFAHIPCILDVKGEGHVS